MKKLLVILTVFFPMVMSGQIKIETNKVFVNFDHIKHFVFPATVNDVTVGSADYILASIIQEAPNVVSLSAVEEKFQGETNLTVVCADGKAYSYSVAYSDTILGNNVLYPGSEKEIQEYNILVNKNSASVLFFPDNIIYFCQGNEESLQLEKMNNIAKVKTSLQEIPHSNIFVIDANNNTYNISVTSGISNSYSYNFSGEKELKYLAKVDVNEIEMEVLLKKAIKTKRKIFSMGMIRDKFEFSLTNVLIKQDLLFFVFEMINSSNIDYDVDFIKCFFVDKKTTKNAVQQEDVVEFIYQNNLQ